MVAEANSAGPQAIEVQAVEVKVKISLWSRCQDFLSLIGERFHFLISLPIVTVLGSALIGHFQYQSEYQEKVKTEASAQISAAEKTFTDVASMFSKAITLQQLIFFNYRDALKAQADADDQVLEAKNARAIFPTYDSLRLSLRESVDLIARRVERDIDWRSDPNHDGAAHTIIGTDPLSRISLGAYDFECEDKGPMPNFRPGETTIRLPPPEDLLKEKPDAQALVLDWNSAKHQLLALHHCFEHAHRQIGSARRWAANSPVDTAARDGFRDNFNNLQNNFDREAVRLNAFMALAARRIETIQVKFRASVWYCHVPLLREAIDIYSKKCTPVRTAERTSSS